MIVQVNLLELCPSDAGLLRGLVNTFYHLAAFLAPAAAGSLTSENVSLNFHHGRGFEAFCINNLFPML